VADVPGSIDQTVSMSVNMIITLFTECPVNLVGSCEKSVKNRNFN
jgi:hypothetical protein